MTANCSIDRGSFSSYLRLLRCKDTNMVSIVSSGWADYLRQLSSKFISPSMNKLFKIGSQSFYQFFELKCIAKIAICSIHL
jgi:hypothetical protein